MYTDEIYEKIDININKSDIVKDEMVRYKPKLSLNYDTKFNSLINILKDMSTHNKINKINKEIEKIDIEQTVDIEAIKFIASLKILRDLLIQGWSMYFEDTLFLCNPDLKMSNKESLRLRLKSEKMAQFKIDSNIKFINRMEKIKKYNNCEISIKDLIGDEKIILNKICMFKEGKNIEIVEPYLQLVENNKKDELTGYKLNDIWRYFRYTWSIPYKSSPGRNLFYLIRDRSQKYHPIIGIAALGNCVLNLGVRDNYIGWTYDSIKNKIDELKYNDKYLNQYSSQILQNIDRFISDELNEIYHEDLVDKDDIINPSYETIDKLKLEYESIKDKTKNIKRNNGAIDYNLEMKTPLYKKKRAYELSKLIEAKLIMKNEKEKYKDPAQLVINLIKSKQGKKVINIALQANRKKKIGSNMMEIIVCGSIPPYNELLGGKLVSLLIASPTVIRDYESRYKNQVSDIASKMKGEEVIKDSKLVFLGTTSLYSVGSSQYNRIKVPINNNILQYKEIGMTEGYGSVFFSKDTTDIINKMMSIIENGRKINNVFGEGTSPRMRLIKKGILALGINSGSLLNHYSPRIVYGINLANNTEAFLNGIDDNVEYIFGDINNHEEATQQLINYWKKRWLNNRVYNIDIEKRLMDFSNNNILLGNMIK